MPAPLRPSSATVSPGAIVRFTPSTARMPPKVLTAPVKDTAVRAPAIGRVPVVFVMTTTLGAGRRARQMHLWAIGRDKCHG
ncbi:hypothetical protein GCM10023335_14440 [Streptomyces siamensis]|uniref:Uncharacterized protein n=1 Tax=Streptomyces siamensis TaxID=1274986 RepID=A0ABP9ILX3_9ACTN